MFKCLVYRFGKFLTNALPLNMSYALAQLLSDLHFYLSFKDRRIVENNLSSFLSNKKDVSLYAKDVFRNFGKYLVEFFRMDTMVDQNFLTNKVNVCNINFIEDALKEGKGVILLSGHIGNWELGAAVLCSLGFPMHVIALPHKERPVNDFFNHQRESKGATIVPSDNAYRKCIKSLRTNEVVAIAADRDYSQTGVVLRFLGRKALLPKGAAVLSLKTGAPIIPVFLLREDDDKFTLLLEEPIYPTKVKEGTIRGQTLVSLMKRYIRVIEKVILKHPTQWLMFREYYLR